MQFTFGIRIRLVYFMYQFFLFFLLQTDIAAKQTNKNKFGAAKVMHTPTIAEARV